MVCIRLLSGTGLNTIEDPQLGEVVVQGRTLPIVRFLNTGGFNMGGAPGGQQMNGEGAACFVDLTLDDDPGFKMLFLMRDPNRSGEQARESITDEAVQEFLVPFVVGDDREVYVAPPGTGPDEGFIDSIQATLEEPSYQEDDGE